MELHVVRAQGELLKQLVRYTVVPSGNSEFYGATGILEFKPGEREVLVALVARPDGEPEVRTVNHVTCFQNRVLPCGFFFFLFRKLHHKSSDVLN